MTAPDPASPLWPEDRASPVPAVPARPLIRALDGNRAALTLLVVQNVVAAVLARQGVPLGAALLGSVIVNVLVAVLLFRPAVNALLQDVRWRTRPDWGVALGAFVLAFLASRAFVLAYVTLFPDAADSVPQFLSSGPDLWLLLLSAGLLIPLLEEVAFRGLMMRGHEHARGFGLAAVTSTVAFSLAHGVPAAIAGIVPLAYVLARVVQHTGSLWNAVILHALNNTLAVGLGAWLSRNSDLAGSLADPSQATELLQNPALRTPLMLGALGFGSVVLLVLHLWLQPRADTTVGARPGPWLSGAYAVIVLFGVLAVLYSFPAVRLAVTDLQGALP